MSAQDAFDRLRHDADLLELAALLVACPVCRADSGADCRVWPFQRILPHPHPSRVALGARYVL